MFVKVFGQRLRYRLGMLQVYIAAAAEHIRIAGEAPAGVGTGIVHRPPVHLTDDDRSDRAQARRTGRLDNQGVVDSESGRLCQDAGL